MPASSTSPTGAPQDPAAPPPGFGKTAIVTGAAVEARRGHRAGAAGRWRQGGPHRSRARTGAALEARLAGAGHGERFVQADIQDFAAREAAYDTLARALGKADILVNNAGISPKTGGRALKAWEMPPQEWDMVMRVNLNAAFYLTRLATPRMMARRQGHIVNMSSVAGKAYCDIVAAHYAATKAGLIGLTRHWAGELGEYGITVNALAPGRIGTPLLKTVPQEVNDAVTRVTPPASTGHAGGSGRCLRCSWPRSRRGSSPDKPSISRVVG